MMARCAKAFLILGLSVTPLPLGYFMELWFPLGDWRWLLVALLCVTPGLFCYRREIWDRLGGLLLRIPSSADRTALRENPGNGWRAGRVILPAKTTDEAEALFRDFMAHPDKSREEYAFAAYWLRTCKAARRQRTRLLARDRKCSASAWPEDRRLLLLGQNHP